MPCFFVSFCFQCRSKACKCNPGRINTIFDFIILILPIFRGIRISLNIGCNHYSLWQSLRTLKTNRQQKNFCTFGYTQKSRVNTGILCFSHVFCVFGTERHKKHGKHMKKHNTYSCVNTRFLCTWPKVQSFQ